MLYAHQQEAVKFAIDRGGKAALFHDPGLGKTLSTLEIFKHYRQQDPSLRLLVICPLSLIQAAWGEDVKKFTDFYYLPYSDLHSTDKPDIIGINFESLIVEKRFKEVQRMLANCSPLHPKLMGNWMICVDESSRMKNHKSMTTKALLRLAPYAKYRLIASGTPAPNNELEFWAQAKFVRNDIFPDSFFQFRNNYFHLGRGNQMAAVQGKIMSRAMMAEMFSHGWKYMITHDNRERLMARLAPICHWVRKRDVLDLPPKIDEIRTVKLNPNERKMYNEMRRHLVAEIKTGRKLKGQNEIKEVVAATALAKIMKLRQATSGFLYNEDHAALRPGRSSKMRLLEETLEELGDRQIKIWIEFEEEVNVICKMLSENEKTFTTLCGETKDKEQSIKNFQDGKSQYLVANPASAAHGLTFINSYIDIFFTLSYSWEKHTQAKQRDERIGQTHSMLCIYLLAEDTVDFMLKDVLDGKKSLQDVYYELVQGEDL